jgi:putative ABC transport system ATP-binding protein
VYERGSDGLLGGEKRRQSVEALKEVSLTVQAGELTVVAGASGSGNSTLLHLLGGLDTPTSGRVEIEGTDTTDLTEHQRTGLRLRSIGIVFQRFHLLPALTARANVGLPLLERGIGKRTRHERAAALLEAVDMDHRLDHRPNELSGGEQQRVAIARALANDPAIVIADEPTGEVDTATGDRIVDLLASVAADRAVVVATHDERVMERADRVIRLRDGTVVSSER